MPRSIGLPGPSSPAIALAARVMVRLIAPLGCVALLIVLGGEQMRGFQVDAFRGHLSGIAWLTILAALVLTSFSYLAISAYDVLAFDLLGRRLPVRALLKSGLVATGLGQALGFGVIVGGIARWRMLRGLGVTPVHAASASALVASGFFFGLAVVFAVLSLLMTSSAAALTGVSEFAIALGSVGMLGLFAALIYATRKGTPVVVLGRTLPMPRPGLASGQVLLAACDIVPAGLALWLLLPDGAQTSFGIVLLAYLVALGAGLLSNMPAGIGAFEAVLIVMLPDVSVEALTAGLLCFRAVYYGAPFLAAVLVLTLTEAQTKTRMRAEHRPTPPSALRRMLRSCRRMRGMPGPQDLSRIERAIGVSERGDANLAFLGDKEFLSSPDSDCFIMYARRGRLLVAMGDPVGPRRDWPDMIERFCNLARAQGRKPVFYKIGIAVAALALANGLSLDRLGHEAIIPVRSFSLDVPHRRELRRKIRKAAKLGIEVACLAPGQADLAELEQIANAWRNAKSGQEKSFSMGHFDPAYLARFPVFVARQNGEAIGFVSVWHSGDGAEWSLDLMRMRPNAPPDTMHAIIVSAIEAARAAGVCRFNLCMAPMGGLDEPCTALERFAAMVFMRAGRLHDLQGLYRFKMMFRPEWQPRFLARPGGATAATAVLSTYRLTARPSPRAVAIGTTPEHPAEPGERAA